MDIGIGVGFCTGLKVAKVREEFSGGGGGIHQGGKTQVLYTSEYMDPDGWILSTSAVQVR